MMNRYGLGIVGFILGLLVFWGLTGFKNPFAKTTTPIAPKEGAACSTVIGGPPNGTIKNGVCVAG